MKMNNFDKMLEMINNYQLSYEIEQNVLSSLRDTSKSNIELPEVYVYNGKNDLEVIDMDVIARHTYKKIKKPDNPEEHPVNSVDAFLISHNNDWYFIEFKDAQIRNDNRALKDNIIKKAYSNWYMLMEILYEMKETEYKYYGFDFNDPVKFAQEHVFYILVCTLNKNPSMYKLIKGSQLAKSKYTPPFMSRLKGYLFKDAFAYTEEFLERKLVNGFIY